MSKRDDNSLMKKLAQGHASAFSELVSRYHLTLLQYSTRIMGGDRSKAEDMVQDVWIKVVKFAPRYDSSRPFKPWLLRVARNRCLSELTSVRETRREALVDETRGEVSAKAEASHEPRFEWLPADEALIKLSDQSKVRQALDSLPPAQRVALLAWLEEDDFVSVLTKELNVSANAVHQLLYRAKKSLKEILSSSDVVMATATTKGDGK